MNIKAFVALWLASGLALSLALVAVWVAFARWMDEQ